MRWLILGLALLTTSCDNESERANVEERLPPGCRLIDAGSYKGDDVLVVACDGRRTTTTDLRWRSGKVNRYASVVWIEENRR
jgi:hypothetical protein